LVMAPILKAEIDRARLIAKRKIAPPPNHEKPNPNSQINIRHPHA